MDKRRRALLVALGVLLGLLPLFGLGFAFFLPGAVPALVLLVRGERTGLIVAAGGGLLLAVAVMMAGRARARYWTRPKP